MDPCPSRELTSSTSDVPPSPPRSLRKRATILPIPNNTGGDDDGNGDGSMVKQAPVRIQETARSAAKVRPPVSPGSSTVNKVLPQDKQPAAQHPAHHFMDGGMPCDPAPPPYSLAQYGEESLYTLILLRHGESEWNSQNRYTGWCDVNLTAAGKEEARRAGRLLYDNNIEIDQAFTSVLKRASFSCNMALNAAQQHWVPVTKTWRLNERHYGALRAFVRACVRALVVALHERHVSLVRNTHSIAFVQRAITKIPPGKNWVSIKNWSCRCVEPMTCDRPS
jgi:phosphohistidine phosphatase SixA